MFLCFQSNLPWCQWQLCSMCQWSSKLSNMFIIISMYILHGWILYDQFNRNLFALLSWMLCLQRFYNLFKVSIESGHKRQSMLLSFESRLSWFKWKLCGLWKWSSELCHVHHFHSMHSMFNRILSQRSWHSMSPVCSELHHLWPDRVSDMSTGFHPLHWPNCRTTNNLQTMLTNPWSKLFLVRH